MSTLMGVAEEYNPLDYGNLTMNLVAELMSREPSELPPPQRFLGSGVYALFYLGDFEPYRSIRSPDFTNPIYVGKAIPTGGRKGASKGSATRGRTLFNRLSEHAGSIEDATNLQVPDFRCRFLVVTPLWITMAERFLIEHYQPIWNVCLDGFGNHDPGRGRYRGEISWWDALHPGRTWAAKLRQTRSQGDARKRLADFLALQREQPEAAAKEAKAAAAAAEASDE